MKRPVIRWLVLESKVLKGNPMGNPTKRRVPVYLPPDYNDKRKDPYPVIAMLAGWGSRGAGYLGDEGVFRPSLPEELDQAIRNGKLPPCILVFPDGGTKLGSSQYINSEANGPFMDHLCDEVFHLMDEEFHTYGDRDHRGLIGHSSGGYGALTVAMLRPDVVTYVCSSAGDAWFEYLYTKPIPSIIRSLEKSGGIEKFVERFFASPHPLRLLSRDDGETMMNLCMASCYTPNLNAPPILGDLWFDQKTGDLIPEVWERLLSWDPNHMIDHHKDSLKKMKYLHLEAGVDDEYGLQIGHRKFAAKCKTHEITHTFEEYSGKHSGQGFRNIDRIRRMVSAMTAL